MIYLNNFLFVKKFPAYTMQKCYSEHYTDTSFSGIIGKMDARNLVVIFYGIYNFTQLTYLFFFFCLWFPLRGSSSSCIHIIYVYIYFVGILAVSYKKFVIFFVQYGGTHIDRYFGTEYDWVPYIFRVLYHFSIIFNFIYAQINHKCINILFHIYIFSSRR